MQRGVEQQQEPGAAGIDHAGVLQHRQHVGRAVERRLAGGAGGVQHVGQRLAAVGGRACAPSAASRTTVRIVPSIGFSTAW